MKNIIFITYSLILLWSLSSCKKDDTLPNQSLHIQYGPLLIDDRDGEEYPTILVKELFWMGENLRFAGLNWSDFSGTSGYDYHPKYGRIYNGENLENICPNGWRLPSIEDCQNLIDAITSSNRIDLAGQNIDDILRSTENWDNNANGKNLIGFNAYPAGYGYTTGPIQQEYEVLVDVGEITRFWTSTTNNDYGPTIRYLFTIGSGVPNTEYRAYQIREYASCRCVKDTE